VDDSAPEFVSLWTRYQPEVRRYVCKLVPAASDAEDVMQQTALRLWEKFNEYDSDRPFVAWAIGFAYHEVLSWRQRQARSRLVFSETILAQLHATIGEEASLLELRRKALDGCLQKVGAQERQLLLRRYSEHGAVQREAGESKTSPHKLYYAIEKLRARLMECIDAAMRQEGWQHG
jgi:RNA polymerase sigma-70 factor, ECF subfamily